MSRLIDKNPCLVKARDDEPAFLVLGRDPAAFATLETWCEERWRKLGFCDSVRTEMALKGIVGKRLSYKPAH